MTIGLAAAVVLAGAIPALAEERYDDAVGDAVGEASDIVAVVVDDSDASIMRFSVELGSEPPVGPDAGHLDLLWITMDRTPEVTFPEYDGLSLITMGDLDGDLEGNSELMAGTEVVPGALEVEIDGPVVTFRFDRELLGGPGDLFFRVHSAALDQTLYTEDIDELPEPDEAPARFSLQGQPD